MKKPPFHKSVIFTVKGILWILRNERNFKIQFLALLFNIILIFYFDLNTTEAALIISICLLVLIAESFNTCIEKICDYIQPHHDKNIGIIKDISGGAVLLATILAIIVGTIIYLPYIKNLFS